MNASTNKQQVLGNYRIGKSIGEGTFGKVRLGVHILTDEKVAVKTLQKEKIIEQSDIERVTREICILKILRHPNIIQLYEIIETKTDIHLIMEYAEGGQLFDFIVKNKRIQQVQAVKFIQQILSGVQYIHKNGIVHRDLKPQNLLLDANKNIKIVDFGLSNQYKAGQKLKTACGSPCYAAPEMIAGKRYECLNVDIWSCGIIIYAMLCGYLPFQDKNTNKLYKKIIAGDFQMPKILSSEARDILKNVLNVNPDTRYKISQIRGSKWYNLCKEKYQAKGIIVGKDKIVIDDVVMREMEKNKFQQTQTKSYVQNNRHNHITAAYYLYKKKFEKNPPTPKQNTHSRQKERDDSPLIYKPQKKPDYYIPQSKKQKDPRQSSRNDSINASNIISSLVEANKNKLINPKFSRKPQNGNFDKVQDFKLFPNKMNSSIYDPNSSTHPKGITNPSQSITLDEDEIQTKKISFTSNDIRRNSFGANYSTQMQSSEPINKKRQELSEQLKQISVKIDKQIVELKKQNEGIEENKKRQFTQSPYLTMNSAKHKKKNSESFNLVSSKQKIKLSKDLHNQSIEITGRERIMSHIPTTSNKSVVPKQHVGPFNVKCLFMESATILFRKIIDFFKLNNLGFTEQEPYEIKTLDNHSIWIESISGSAGLYLVNFSGSMPINQKILQVLAK